MDEMTIVDAIEDAIDETAAEADRNTVILPVKAVIIYDEKGNYVVHADNNSTTEAMFKRLTDGSNSLWTFNPNNDRAEVIDLTLKIVNAPELPKARVYGTQY